MADKKISDLTLVSSVQKNIDQIAVVQSPGVETNKATVAQLAAALVQREQFTATAGQTVFNLSFSYTLGSGNLFVYVNGLLMEEGALNDYQETTTTSITFNFTLDPPDKVTVMYF